MNKVDGEYFRLLNTVINDGATKHNRTGTDTLGVFGEQAKFKVDLNAFPILTTKRVWFKGIVHELLWFIKGDTNIKYLVDNDVHIWDEWAYKKFCDAQKGLDGVITKTLVNQEQFIDNIKKFPDFAEKWGELGEGTYGSMWRNFPFHSHDNRPNFTDTVKYSRQYDGCPDYSEVWTGTVDQLKKVINTLNTNPDSRRMIVSAWHPYWVEHCALPPCHCLFHFNTEELTQEERMMLWNKSNPPYEKRSGIGGLIEKYMDEDNIPKRRLNLLLYQRSCDLALGVPFNISSYSLLLAMVAHCVNMTPGTFVHTYGDLHLYKNHMKGVVEQLGRDAMKLPKLWLNPNIRNLFEFKYEDIKLIEYNSHPTIKFDVAV